MTDAIPHRGSTLLTAHHPGAGPFRTALLAAAVLHLALLLAVPPGSLSVRLPEVGELPPLLPPMPDPVLVPAPPAEVAPPVATGDPVVIEVAEEPEVPLLPLDEPIPLPGPVGDPGMEPWKAGINEAPVPIHTVAPRYPDLARQAGAEGTVLVEVTLDERGRVIAARVVRHDTVESLRRAALEAARGWLFRPALQRGKPVSTRIEIPFTFRID